jgi:single-strand selective monofunctional uracil DNA glycosylase
VARVGVSLFARSTISLWPEPVKRASFKSAFIVSDAGGIDSLPLPRLSRRVSDALIAASRTLADRLRPLTFSTASHVYLPLDYAREPHEADLKRFGGGKKRVVFLGMNPGPFGMAQTGVPFGEVPAVRDWMGISSAVGKPAIEHPKRPIQGFDCPKSEVSGRRLWGLFAERFPKAEDFFKDHFVINYCPLVWMSATGANLTPDKLPSSEMVAVDKACLDHLAATLEVLQPQYLIGVGGYAEERLKAAAELTGTKATLGRVLHPSPASPAANRGWAEAATKQLLAQGVWE